MGWDSNDCRSHSIIPGECQRSVIPIKVSYEGWDNDETITIALSDIKESKTKPTIEEYILFITLRLLSIFQPYPDKCLTANASHCKRRTYP